MELTPAIKSALDAAEAAAWMATNDEERRFGFVDPAVDLEAYEDWMITPLYTRDEVERLLQRVTSGAQGAVNRCGYCGQDMLPGSECTTSDRANRCAMYAAFAATRKAFAYPPSASRGAEPGEK